MVHGGELIQLRTIDEGLASTKEALSDCLVPNLHTRYRSLDGDFGYARRGGEGRGGKTV